MGQKWPTNSQNMGHNFISDQTTEPEKRLWLNLNPVVQTVGTRSGPLNFISNSFDQLLGISVNPIRIQCHPTKRCHPKVEKHCFDKPSDVQWTKQRVYISRSVS